MFFVSIVFFLIDGLINCFLKGLDFFCVLDEFIVVYIDLVGSGIEIVVYLKENG